MPASRTMDLHVHSSFSDGSLAPGELAARARRNNVAALSISDHDTLDGFAEKERACREENVIDVPGVELSCQLGDKEVHILSLYADPLSPWIDCLREFVMAREKRMRAMLDKLAGLGVKLEMADIPSGSGVVGRPHLARAMVAKGVVKTVSEAFGRYLYDGGPVHAPKRRFSVGEGIDLAKRLGGAAVLAHPGVSGLIDSLDELRLLGLDGIEAYHPRHGGETLASLLRYCRDAGQLVSGGSDFHAPGESSDIGSQKTPVDLLEPLRDRAEDNREQARRRS